MVLLQGVHVSEISPIRSASECSVVKDEGGTTTDCPIMNARTLIVSEWHDRSPERCT